MSEQPDPLKFQDPLENYDPKSYSDRLEQALADETVAAIQSTPYVTISPETPIDEAIKRLAEMHVACLLVATDGKLVGVFSHRDALDKVALNYEERKNSAVSEVMTRDPVFVYETDSAGAVLSVMAVSGYRHVPVLAADGTIVGIASPQRVTEFLQHYFQEE